ncbi:hypothetical protein NP493_363g02027 [Ridgeia piscesae]|uniref:Uncharacterized protein n=1 Tax=Ridgeia piscesae TaxID=27915 RepID=A0AAD9L2J9_RIDPI|nr:hypothetical protein NP493_363g02027 [Ridgeia piscesae]
MLRTLVRTKAIRRKAISKSTQDSSNLLHPSHAEYGYQKRELRSSVDWTEAAVNGEHMWTDTSASGDFCYVGEGPCLRTGQRKKCAACKILIHTGCLAELERNTSMRHHWVHRRRQEGKCKQCCKVGHRTTLHHTAPHASTTCCKHHTQVPLMVPLTAPLESILGNTKHHSQYHMQTPLSRSTTYKHHTWRHMQAPRILPLASTTCCTTYKHHSLRHAPP